MILAALDLLVPAEAEVVAPVLRGARGAIAMDAAGVRTIVPMKAEDRALEKGIKTAICAPAPQGAIDACVMNFRTALPILLDRQFFPLAADVERFQDVVEDRVRAELSRGASTASAEMRPDK